MSSEANEPKSAGLTVEQCIQWVEIDFCDDKYGEAILSYLRAYVSRQVASSKDAARLDWLDKQECGFVHESYGDYKYYCSPRSTGTTFVPARETIDEIMQGTYK